MVTEMAAPLPRKPPRAELEYMLSFKRIQAFEVVARQVIQWGALIWIARYGYLSIMALAGRQTFADVALNFLANLKVSQGICYLVTLGSILYGLGQRQLRRRNIRRLAHDKNELERILDPKRTSSNLTDKGTTRPGDEP